MNLQKIVELRSTLKVRKVPATDQKLQKKHNHLSDYTTTEEGYS